MEYTTVGVSPKYTTFYATSTLGFSAVEIVGAVLGIFANVINIQAFLTMGVRDAMTLSFVFLSSSDLVYVLAVLIRAITSLFFVTEILSQYSIIFPVDPFGLVLHCRNAALLLHALIVLTTTYIAIARCMCVFRPLQFKHAFTMKRSGCVFGLFGIFAVVSYIPVLVTMGMTDMLDKKINRTRTTLWMASNRELIKDIVWNVRDTFLTLLTQVIVLTCVVVMANSLRKASKFRHARTVGRSHTFNSPADDIFKTSEDPSVTKATIPDPPKIDVKGRHVINQVLLISLMHVICNTPKILVNIVGIFEADLAIGQRLENQYLIINAVCDIFQLFNSSINVVIYYKYNAKFRTHSWLC